MAHFNSSPDTVMKSTFKSSHYKGRGDLLQKDSKELSISSGDWKLRCYRLHKHSKVLLKIVAGAHEIIFELSTRKKRLFQPNTILNATFQATRLEDFTPLSQNFKTTAGVKIISNINRGT